MVYLTSSYNYYDRGNAYEESLEELLISCEQPIYTTLVSNAAHAAMETKVQYSTDIPLKKEHNVRITYFSPCLC